MINEAKKIIYIHPPKTGGWSIVNLYGSTSPIPEKKGKFEITPQHHSIKFYKNYGFDLDRYLIFATTRNPWDRVVSAYSWLKSRDIHRLAHNGSGAKCNFEEFVYWLEENEEVMRHDRDNHDWRHPFAVWDWITIEGHVAVDYLCSMHTLQSDYEFLSNKIGLKKSLPHSNKSEHGDYRKYYNSKMIDSVAKVFNNDIQYFKFNFENKDYSDFSRVVDDKKISKMIMKGLGGVKI